MKIKKISDTTKYFILVGFVFTLCVAYSIISDRLNDIKQVEIIKETEEARAKQLEEWRKINKEMQPIKQIPGTIGDEKYDECVGYIHETYLHTIPKPVPLYINQVCSCFAEKMGTYEKKSTKEELDKYKASKVYSIKIKSKNYETCMEKTTVDTGGYKKYW